MTLTVSITQTQFQNTLSVLQIFLLSLLSMSSAKHQQRWPSRDLSLYVKAADFLFGSKIMEPCGVSIINHGKVQLEEVLNLISVVKESLREARRLGVNLSKSCPAQVVSYILNDPHKHHLSTNIFI